jgi:phosphoserine phosphatase RsbX
MEAVKNEMIQWSVASLPFRGQVESGDCYVVRQYPHGALIAAIDGVGHGPEAAAAARLTAQVLEDYVYGAPLTALLIECHERLLGTRGAVVSLAFLDATHDSITWLGVGNIEGMLLRSSSHSNSMDAKQQEMLLPRAGVVGHQLPRLLIHTLSLHHGDILIFATDGIRSEFADNISTAISTAQIANNILERYALETDDALVLVVRYLHEQEPLNHA